MKQEIVADWMPYLYWLDTIPNFGRSINFKLLEVYGSPKAIYNIEEIEIRRWLHQKQLTSFMKAKKKTVEEILEAYEALRERGIQFIPYCHERYPNRLKDIPDKPFALYVSGSLPRENAPSIAMIGARRCSEYGKYMAREFAREFAGRGYQIVSEMAMGIDGISQRTALECGTDTYAVLGCGVDVCYPKENRDIFHMIPEHGGIISEYPLGTQPLAGQFPPRNRIISALSDVVLVVEAKEKSGTLITVDMALEQGKEVYAIPGRCTDLLSAGCNQLLKQGAGIAISPQQMIEELYGEIKKQEEGQKHIAKPMINLSPLGIQLTQIMGIEPKTIDEIHMMLLQAYPQKSCSVTDLMCELMDLQLKGFVGRVGGKYNLLKL